MQIHINFQNGRKYRQSLPQNAQCRQSLPQNEHTHKHKYIRDQIFRNKVFAISWIHLEYMNIRIYIYIYITPSWYFSFPCYCGSNMAAARLAASWQFGEQIISSREVFRTAMLTPVCSTLLQRMKPEERRKHNVATVWWGRYNGRHDVIEKMQGDRQTDRQREKNAGSTQCP